MELTQKYQCATVLQCFSSIFESSERFWPGWSQKDIIPLENFWKEHQERSKAWHAFHRKDNSGYQLHWHCSLEVCFGSKSSDCFHLPFTSLVAEQFGRSQVGFPTDKVYWKISTSLWVLSPYKQSNISPK